MKARLFLKKKISKNRGEWITTVFLFCDKELPGLHILMGNKKKGDGL